MSIYSLRSQKDLKYQTVEDILASSISKDHKSEITPFRGFETPSPPESLHLGELFSTDSLSPDIVTPTVLTLSTKVSIMDFTLEDIKKDWYTKKDALHDKLDF